jgi:hypothetical protein
MQPEKSSLSGSLLRIEGVILIILTATAYTAFLMREMGYADEFAIPQELIATSHIGLVSAAKALVWGATAYIAKVNLVWIFAPRGDRLLFSLLRHAIGFSLIVGFAMYPYLATGVSWWWFSGIIVTLVFFWFVFPLITQKGIVGYENKIAEQARIESRGNDIYGLLFSQLDKTTTVMLSFVLAIMVFAHGDGRRSAIEQEKFNVLDGEPNFVVLRIYGDTVVSAAFDPKTLQLDGLVTVAKLSEEKRLGIRLTTLGRLKKAVTK